MTVERDVEGGRPPAGRLVLRAAAGVLAISAVLAASGSLLSGGSDDAAADRPGLAVRGMIWIGSALLYLGVMAPVARLAHGRRAVRFLTVLVPLYVTGAVSDLLEGYFYTTSLSGGLLVAALVVELVPVGLIALAVVLAVPPAAERPPAADAATAGPPGAGPRSWRAERSAWSWCWRILVAGLPYAAIYELFATLVTPIEHRYYSDPAFIASLHTRIPSTGVTLGLEAARGVLFVLAALPVLRLYRGSRRAAFLQIAAIGAVVEAYVPLLGRTTWPAAMRLGNVLELTCDAAARAALMVLLLHLPPGDGGHGPGAARRGRAQVPSGERGAARSS